MLYTRGDIVVKRGALSLSLATTARTGPIETKKKEGTLA